MNNNYKSQFFNTREEIKKWLDKHKMYNYTINDDLSVDVDDSVFLSKEGIKTIPVKFRNVTGSFWCSDNKLKSLTGSPETVGMDFWCDNNFLTNLAESPKLIKGDFMCFDNSLTSLSELNNCIFRSIIFNIDESILKKEEEELELLKKYYNRKEKMYVLTHNEFRDIVEPILQKKFLMDKLNKIENYTKTKNIFI